MIYQFNIINIFINVLDLCQQILNYSIYCSTSDNCNKNKLIEHILENISFKHQSQMFIDMVWQWDTIAPLETDLQGALQKYKV